MEGDVGEEAEHALKMSCSGSKQVSQVRLLPTEDADDSGEATPPLSLAPRPPWRAHRRRAHGAGSVMFAGRKLEGEKGCSGGGKMGEKKVARVQRGLPS
jgi:hypothetical protein